MRTACTEYGRSYRESGSYFSLCGFGDIPAHEFGNIAENGSTGVLACGLYIVCQLAENFSAEVILSADICKFTLDYGVKLLDTEDFIQSSEEFNSLLFGERERS